MPTSSTTRRNRTTGAPISKLELNRALLARQLLLKRADLSAIDALRRLAGMQAQSPYAPYYGLWTRLENFEPSNLAGSIERREAVRIALMRSTVHLVASEDALAWRPLVQPVLERMHKSVYGRHLDGIDRTELVDKGRAQLDAEPMTFDQLGKRLLESWPGRNPAALAMELRTHAALVQVPPRGIWGKGGVAAHATVEHWLVRSVDKEPNLAAMIQRYLAAFGPASVLDVQTWSGLTRLASTLDAMRHELAVFVDDNGRELFDLPEAPRPPGATPAPIRYLAEYDNTILSYADTTRIVSVEHRKRLMTNNGIVHGTFLVDGFVRGSWKIKREKGRATLVVTPFAPLSSDDRKALEAEGARLLQFAAAGQSHECRFEPDSR